MLTTFFASGGARSGKVIGVGALLVVAVGGLVYSLSSYGGDDTITPVTESADGQVTMRKLSCGKCGYEEEVTSVDYNERMKGRADPTQWLECPKCHENAVQRASSGKPFGSPAPADATAEASNPASNAEQPAEESLGAPKVGTRAMSPGG